MEPSKEYLFTYQGFYFGVNTSLEYVASLEDFEIKDCDILITTYPKSGHHNGTENVETMDRIPWLEYKIKNKDYANLPLPHVFATHLPYYLVPRDLRNKRGRDIRSAMLKICNFLGKKLSEEEADSVVRHATFENMRKDPRANYKNLPDDIVAKDKGTVGDWKNITTVAQSETFDKVLKEKMKTLPVKFIWDINDEMQAGFEFHHPLVFILDGHI